MNPFDHVLSFLRTLFPIVLYVLGILLISGSILSAIIFSHGEIISFEWGHDYEVTGSLTIIASMLVSFVQGFRFIRWAYILEKKLGKRFLSCEERIN